MKSKKGQITDALEIMNKRYYKTAKRLADLEEARVNAAAARLIYQLRAEANLSQKQLAELIGTKQSVISRLEDDDYGGHSLTMLARISAALNRQLVFSANPIQDVA